MVVTPEIAAADAAQRRALDPAASVWVSASAGTGKTKVLTERLLTLMLTGTDPARILCLTFTRAAAAEMANRLNERLARWTVLEAGRLHEELVQLTGRNPDEEDFRTARRLFSRVLDTPGGMKIETIHAFCQSLLRRFPLEAGVPPEFTVTEERSAAETLSDAVAGIIAQAQAGTRPDLAAALEVVARYTIDDGFDKLMAELARQRGKLGDALRGGEDALAVCLARSVGLASDETAERLAARFLAGGDLPALRLACTALAQGSAADAQRGAAIADWCADETARTAMLDRYLSVFLTRDGDIQKRLFTQGAAKNAACDLSAVMAEEAARAKAFCEARNNLVIIGATRALVRLGQALVEAYDARKRLHAQLDYDDLVLTALALLRREGVAPWVLFKLDGGIDHILIDEAQDTNPEQWEIVALLAEEFFAGEDPLGRLRTVFAVGDGKQSIYSFQRADPRAFVEMRRHFEKRVSEANRTWRPVPLDISFRAAAPLLAAVDAVFAQPQAADGVALDATAIRHVAARVGQAGLVELWPGTPATADEPDDPLADDPPAHGATKAHACLAKTVAATIAGWLRNGELLASRDRPVKAGDVMVLVRRRNEFVEALLGELKQRNVPVAGADRLTLFAQLAVKDLVALGQFLLLPEDDLTLAAVLKGPLFGVSEEQLFDLAYDRAGVSLWSRLRRRAGGDPLLGRTLQMLDELLNRADFAPPYELYADILGARGGRRAMLERLGPEADDPIDEFLALTLAYEREHVPSLQGFLHWLVAGDIEVKRDLAEQQRDEVRIMTVHGAKGLEAPIVFLPDTMQLPPQRPGVLWTEEDGLPLWRPHADFTTDHHTKQRQALRRRELQEYRRLLYVALTRAQDRLYICGWQTKIAAGAETWYTLCQGGLTGLAEPFDFDTTPLIGEGEGWSGQGLRLAAPQTGIPKREVPPLAGMATAGSPPAWLDRPAPAEPDPPKPLLPSRPSGSEPATLSPLAAGGRDRFKRGLLVHRLLQTLPELPAPERDGAARRFLALPVHALDPVEQEDIRRETIAVLEAPDFAALWGPDAQAEVPVVGLIGGRALSGQIDRILVTGDRVLIVDYKTVRPPPRSESEVADVYLRQLATYRAALERIYPGRTVACAILWTEAPRLMPISPDLLARHLP